MLECVVFVRVEQARIVHRGALGFIVLFGYLHRQRIFDKFYIASFVNRFLIGVLCKTRQVPSETIFFDLTWPGTLEMSSTQEMGVPADAPRPRLCRITKWPDFDGYGFHLQAIKSKPGQFIGKIDDSSPAESAGLRSVLYMNIFPSTPTVFCDKLLFSPSVVLLLEKFITFL